MGRNFRLMPVDHVMYGMKNQNTRSIMLDPLRKNMMTAIFRIFRIQSNKFAAEDGIENYRIVRRK